MSGSVFKILWICLIAVVIVTANDAANHNLERTNRIVNGQLRAIEDFPYIVQIRDSRTGTFCGGTLVAPQYVVTAAHCFAPPYHQFKTLTVVGGASKRSEPGVQRKIVSLSIHPEYEIFYAEKGTILEHQIGSKADVVVVKLDKPFEETDNIKVMKTICNGSLSADNFIEVYGWGHTQQVDPHSTIDVDWNFSEQLRSVRLPVISNDECSKKLSANGLKLSDTNVCAFKKEHDSCVSDSGGPGISGGELCAIVSYGVGCAYGEQPGVYTSIHTIRKFIDDEIKA